MFDLLNKYKQQKRQKTTRKIFFFSFLSAAISAIATIFLTPVDGETARRVVAQKTDETKTKIQKESGKLSKKIANKTKLIKSKGSEIFKKASDKIKTRTASESKAGVKEEEKGK